MTNLVNRTGLPTVSQPPQYDFILLDGSGSMSGKWWPMLDAIDTYVATLKTQMLSTHINLTVFDSHDLALVQRDCPIDSWTPMRAEPIGSHFGGTPLYDAIIAMGLRLREINPKRASILIVTDGEEADSKCSLAQAQSVIKWMKAQGWQVTFLGCDFANDNQAKALGATAANTIGVAKALLSDAAASFGRKRAAYGNGGDDISFTDDEKTKFGGYLDAPSRG